MYAARYGRYSTAAVLLDWGASVNMRDDVSPLRSDMILVVSSFTFQCVGCDGVLIFLLLCLQLLKRLWTISELVKSTSSNKYHVNFLTVRKVRAGWGRWLPVEEFVVFPRSAWSTFLEQEEIVLVVQRRRKLYCHKSEFSKYTVVGG